MADRIDELMRQVQRDGVGSALESWVSTKGRPRVMVVVARGEQMIAVLERAMDIAADDG